MGKVEDMRALREAMRETQQRMAQPPAKRAPKIQGTRPTQVLVDEVVSWPGSELCGHRSISNKTCIRPINHTEKNHRYGKA